MIRKFFAHWDTRISEIPAASYPSAEDLQADVRNSVQSEQSFHFDDWPQDNDMY
jgi:hypothetical protein